MYLVVVGSTDVYPGRQVVLTERLSTTSQSKLYEGIPSSSDFNKSSAPRNGSGQKESVSGVWTVSGDM